jgi:hypothetical protein
MREKREAFLRDAVSPPRPLQYIFDGGRDSKGDHLARVFFLLRPQTQISRCFIRLLKGGTKKILPLGPAEKKPFDMTACQI